MSLASLEKDAATETYEDLKGLIDHTVWKFHCRYGGDREELRSHAMELFMLARLQEYDPERSAFTSFIRYKVWHGLLESLRTEVGRNNRIPREYLDLSQVFAPDEFDMDGFTSRLSDEARWVVQLAFDPPRQVIVTLGLGDDWRSASPVDLRKALKEYLLDWGLKVKEINDRFREIRNAL